MHSCSEPAYSHIMSFVRVKSTVDKNIRQSISFKQIVHGYDLESSVLYKTLSRELGKCELRYNQMKMRSIPCTRSQPRWFTSLEKKLAICTKTRRSVKDSDTSLSIGPSHTPVATECTHLVGWLCAFKQATDTGTVWRSLPSLAARQAWKQLPDMW